MVALAQEAIPGKRGCSTSCQSWTVKVRGLQSPRQAEMSAEREKEYPPSSFCSQSKDRSPLVSGPQGAIQGLASILWPSLGGRLRSPKGVGRQPSHKGFAETENWGLKARRWRIGRGRRTAHGDLTWFPEPQVNCGLKAPLSGSSILLAYTPPATGGSPPQQEARFLFGQIRLLKTCYVYNVVSETTPQSGVGRCCRKSQRLRRIGHWHLAIILSTF